MLARSCCLLAVCPLLGFFSESAQAVTRVPLVINEAFPDRGVPWPVTTGVPFPRGGLKKAENCRLVDDQGKEQPLQAKVAATWDAEKTSIRWLTIDFIAQPGRKYALEFGDEVQRRARDDRWGVAEDGPRYLVAGEVGNFSSMFTNSKPATIRGLITTHGDMIASPNAGEHYLIDQDGRTYSSGPDHPDRKLQSTAGGPVRASVQVSGYYVGPAGERIAAYRTHYHFFRGIPGMKVVDELKFITSTAGKRFRDIGFRLEHSARSGEQRVTVDRSGEPGNQPLVAFEGSLKAGSNVSLFQETYRHYGNPECRGEVTLHTREDSRKIATPEHVGEWVQVTGNDRTITGSLRWFWQQFPKEWEVTNDSLTLHYWSPKAGELDFGKEGIEKFFGSAGKKYLRAGRENHNRNPLDHAFYHADLGAIERGEADGLGINKHHEFWLIFTPAKDAKLAQDYARHAALQPLCLASGEWNCSTDVFGPLAARPNDSKYEAAVDKIFDLGRQGQDDFGDYGWWLFGAGPHYSYHTDEKTGKLYADSRRFDFHTYAKETQLWWSYLRSGERKFYDWAIPSENHWCDIAVAHEPTKIHCDWLGGTEQKNRTLHWRPGEWSIDNPTHYIRTHDRAEAWLRGGAQFWASYHRTLETTSLAHYLTGDPRYSDVINYWRDYWKDLAGKTNRSADWKSWHREQAWYQTFKASPKEMTWAEMIRDYAPFGSGSRHQQTLFFNLATLYEHTWDPQIKQVLEEYAAAFLDEKHPIGVWPSQDNSLPAHAEAPAMAHFWGPALWKYERVTRDPRMKEIFRKYFDTAYAADPFREFEDVGVYSNTYCAYAYYFTRDPRYLTLAKHELDQLLPYSLPLKNPQEINQRLYNPYAPAKTFTAVPRLLWALQAGAKEGKEPGPKPLPAQRTTIQLTQAPGKELTATLWGFEPKLTIHTQGRRQQEDEPFNGGKVTTRQYASEIQPFDRVLPNYECYLHEVTIPANETGRTILLKPRLEVAVLATNSAERVQWDAAQPISLKSGEGVVLQRSDTLKLRSAHPQALRVILESTGEVLKPAIQGNLLVYAVKDLMGDHLRIEFAGSGNVRQVWFQVEGTRSHDPAWVHPLDDSEVRMVVCKFATYEKFIETVPRLIRPRIEGKFGGAVEVAEKQQLHIPDHIVVDGNKQRLFDEQQGTIEFWIRRRFDDRLSTTRPPPLLTNGLFTVAHQSALPLREWAHIAVVWHPYRDRGTIQYVYVNGRDSANYRSINWDGYSAPRPGAGPKNAKWLEAFIAQAGPDSPFEIDELRVSKIARYADLKVAYGPQQTFNPIRFTPPAKAFEPDEHTTLLLHFDGDLKSAVPGVAIEGTFADKK